MFMVSNISLFEVVVRLAGVLVITLVSLFLDSLTVYVVSMVLLVSALAQYCPIYHLLGINRCKSSSTH